MAGRACLDNVLKTRTEHMVGRIRIALVELPPMLSDIIARAIELEHDMDVVDGGVHHSLAQHAGQDIAMDTDVLVTGLEEETLADRSVKLMRQRPDLKVLGITGDARRLILFELRPHRLSLGQASTDGLIHAIRSVMRREAC